MKIKETIFNYANLEKDFRGYIPEKGWAHSVAHLADCLDELALCNEIEQEDVKQILCFIRTLMRTREIAYVYGEDERMVTAILSIIKRNLIEKEAMLRWIHDLSVLDNHMMLPYDRWQAKNIKNLLRSLYFRTLDITELTWVSEASILSLKDVSLQFREYY